MTLNLGDSSLSGREIVSRKLVGFTSEASQTFTYVAEGVATSVDTVTPEAADILQNVGQYKFEKKADGYYVDYVAYAEADEIGAMNTWTGTVDGNWATAGNWSSNSVPAEGADGAISITADTTITIPAEGVSVGTLLVSGEGTLTIAGGKITAAKVIMDGAGVTATQATLDAVVVQGTQKTECLTFDIAENKTVTMLVKDCALTKKGDARLEFQKPASTAIFEAVNVTLEKGELKLIIGGSADPLITDTTFTYVDADSNGEADGWLTNYGWVHSTTSTTFVVPENVTGKAFLDGNITDTGAVIKQGDGVLLLGITANSNAGTYTGTTTIEAGTINYSVSGNYGATLSGVISGAGKVGLAAGTLTLTANNTYTGGTVIAEGAVLKVQKMSALGAANTEVNIAKGGKVTVTSTGNVTEDNDVARAVFAGEGTVEFNGAGYYVLPNNFKAPAYLINNQAENLTIATNGTYDVGSYSGEKYFRMDYNQKGNRAFVITQRADATIASDIVQMFGSINDNERLTDVTVKGVDGATLTLSGAHNNIHFRTLTIDATGSVNLAGGWKGNVVANGKLAGEGSIGGTLTLADGATLAGAVTVTGDVTVEGALTITHATAADDTVITCANAEAVVAALTGAPEGLKYVAEDGAVKLAVAKKTNFVVTVGEETVNCETVAEALEALAANGGSLQIAADADSEALALTETLTIAADTTIDFNGKALTSTADPAIHVTGGTLTLTGEGSITAPGVVIQQGTKNAGLTTTVIVGEDVELISFRTEGEDYDGDNVVLLYGKATLESAGVLLTYSKGYAAIQGSGGDAGAETAITITGGQVVNNGDVAIYQPQKGTLTITGGVISGSTAIYAKAGTISITGGEISGTGAQCAYGENRNGCGSTGDALVIDETAGYADLSVSITGGAFTSTNAAAVASYAGAGETAVTGVVKADATATFSSDVSDLCEAGYKTEANDEGVYGVVADPAYGKVAKVGDTYYATLAEAYEAGSEITLIADVEGPGLVINKNVTIDFGEFAYTFTEGVGSGSLTSNGFQILKGNTVTLKNGTLKIADAAKEKFYTVIQNYADLTLVNMTIDGTNTDKWSATDGDSYALSINSGTVSIDAESAIIANDEGDKAYAFDVCKYASYDAPTVTVADDANIEGNVALSGGTLVGGASLPVESGVEGYEAVYDDATEGWILKKIITLPEALVDSPAAEAIKTAMEDAGVAEITECIIVTKGAGADAPAEVVANVLEVFEVTPDVDANGVLTVTYEFGISKMTKSGDTITITAGVTGAEYREGVTVGFYADGEEVIGTATTGADSTEVSITADAADLNGKKITVKATK